MHGTVLALFRVHLLGSGGLSIHRLGTHFLGPGILKFRFPLQQILVIVESSFGEGHQACLSQGSCESSALVDTDKPTNT